MPEMTLEDMRRAGFADEPEGYDDGGYGYQDYPSDPSQPPPTQPTDEAPTPAKRPKASVAMKSISKTKRTKHKTQVSGEVDTTSPEYAKFRQLCGVQLLVDDDNRNPILCVFANVKRNGEITEYKRCIALQPIIEMLADKIRAYHNALHSGSNPEAAMAAPTVKDAAGTNIAGLWPYTARKDIIGITVNTTPASHRHSRGAIPYTKTIDSDKEDLPPLAPGQDPLLVQGWFDSIVSTARHLGQSKAMKDLYSGIKDVASNDLVQKTALSAAIGPQAASQAIDLAHKVYPVVMAAKDGDPAALAKLGELAQAAASGNPTAIQAIDTATHINNKINDKAAAEVPTHASGWLYNRPYRTNAQVLADGLTGHFPTVSMAIREGWHDGLAFAGSMQRRPLIKLG